MCGALLVMDLITSLSGRRMRLAQVEPKKGALVQLLWPGSAELDGGMPPKSCSVCRCMPGSRGNSWGAGQAWCVSAGAQAALLPLLYPLCTYAPLYLGTLLVFHGFLLIVSYTASYFVSCFSVT